MREGLCPNSRKTAWGPPAAPDSCMVSMVLATLCRPRVFVGGRGGLQKTNCGHHWGSQAPSCACPPAPRAGRPVAQSTADLITISTAPEGVWLVCAQLGGPSYFSLASLSPHVALPPLHAPGVYQRCCCNSNIQWPASECPSPLTHLLASRLPASGRLPCLQSAGCRRVTACCSRWMPLSAAQAPTCLG